MPNGGGAGYSRTVLASSIPESVCVCVCEPLTRSSQALCVSFAIVQAHCELLPAYCMCWRGRSYSCMCVRDGRECLLASGEEFKSLCASTNQP